MEHTKAYLAKVLENDRIAGDLYTQFNVKRGLRNADGTGVLVGLTRVGDVHGYIVDEGEKVAVDGKLYYRGIDIEEIAAAAARDKRFCFEETVYLLLFGDLPNQTQLDEFNKVVGSCRELPRHFAEDAILKAPSRDIMNKLARSVLTLYSYDDDPENQTPENVLRQCIELIARFPTIMAYSYMAKRHNFSQESLIIHKPEPGDSSAENILALIRPDRNFTKLEAEILDLALMLHAEHGGGNNSTFSVHLVSSADTDTYSAIAAGIGSLKGFKHGGANIKVMQMMDDIKENIKDWEDEEEITKYLISMLKGEVFDKTGLIYGLGHAVYTKTDPRTIILREKATALAEDKGLMKEFKLYSLIEQLGPKAFTMHKGADKSICTNVDFFSGFVYKMLGIPSDLYTPIFAASRIAGWCAHRLEEIISGGKIIRPAYKCVQKRSSYVSIQDR